VVHPDRSHAQQDLIRSRFRRSFALHQSNLAIAKKLQRSNHGHMTKVLKD
jgi:hypothetical protein